MTDEFKIRYKKPLRAVRWASSKIEDMKKYIGARYFQEPGESKRCAIIRESLPKKWAMMLPETLFFMHDLKNGDVLFYDPYHRQWNVISKQEFSNIFERVEKENA